MCWEFSESNQGARTVARKIQACRKRKALFSAQPVSSLEAPLVGARMPPYGMPSVTGMHRAHVVSVVRPIDRVWVRTPLLTGCVCSKRRCHDVTCCQRKVCWEGGEDAAPRVRCDRFTSYTTHIHRQGRSTARRGREECQVDALEHSGGRTAAAHQVERPAQRPERNFCSRFRARFRALLWPYSG